MKLKRTLSAILSLSLCLSLGSCALTDRISAGAYTEGGAEIKAEISVINIDWPKGNVIVAGTGGDSIWVSEINSTQYKCAYRIIGSVLYIRAAKPGLSSDPKQLNLRIPSSVNYKEIEVRSDSANVAFRNVNVGRADIECMAGDISVAASTITEEAELSTDSGDISLYSGKIKDYDIESMDGAVTISTSVSPEDMDVSTSAGAISVSLPSSAVFVPNISTDGKVKNAFEGTDGHKFNIISKSGNVTLTKTK